MAIICKNGHLYDPELYAVCPYCDSDTQSVNSAKPPVTAGSSTLPVSGSCDAAPAIKPGFPKLTGVRNPIPGFSFTDPIVPGEPDKDDSPSDS